jgi:hypothetical protein
MSKNENKANNKQEKTVIIACYRRPYTEKSLSSIKDLLKEEKTKKVIILSIAESKKSSPNVESYLGLRDVKNLKDKIEEDKTIRAARYTDKIIDICKKLDTKCEKIEKKGKAAKIILEEAKEYKPSHIVIHRSDKSRIDKHLSGSVKDEVCKESMCIVTVL